jgi:hypothetical protein
MYRGRYALLRKVFRADTRSDMESRKASKVMMAKGCKKRNLSTHRLQRNSNQGSCCVRESGDIQARGNGQCVQERRSGHSPNANIRERQGQDLIDEWHGLHVRRIPEARHCMVKNLLVHSGTPLSLQSIELCIHLCRNHVVHNIGSQRVMASLWTRLAESVLAFLDLALKLEQKEAPISSASPRPSQQAFLL